MINGELANPKNDEEKKLFDDRNIAYIKDEFEAFMVEMFFNGCEASGVGARLNYAFCKDCAAKNGLEIVDIWGILNQMLSAAIEAERGKLQ